MITFEQRLDSGRSGSCGCPAHDDSSPSLSVKFLEGSDRVLIYCHAGCEFFDILAAADLVGDSRLGSSKGPRKPAPGMLYRQMVGTWRKARLIVVCKQLRDRDQVIVETTVESEEAWEGLSRAHAGYHELEREFSYLNSRAYTAWLRLYWESHAEARP